MKLLSNMKKGVERGLYTSFSSLDGFARDRRDGSMTYAFVLNYE